jgi:indole-3-glycerol phosphate synthase
LDNSRTLARSMQSEEVWISASGIAEPGEVREMAGLGFTAVLVGTSLMAAPDPGRKLAALAAGARA